MCRQGNQPQLLQGHSLHSTGRPSRTFAGLAFSRRATSASKAAFTAELMRKSPLAVPLQRGQAVLTGTHSQARPAAVGYARTYL